MRPAVSIALALFLALPAGPALAEPPPIEVFFKRAAIVDAALSPSGDWLAMTARAKNGRVGLAVVDVAGKETPRFVATLPDGDIRSFHWVGHERLVFDIVDLASGSGDQPFGRGLFSVRRDGAETRQLVRLNADLERETRRAGRDPLERNHVLLAVPIEVATRTVVVGELKRDAQFAVANVNPIRLDVATGVAERIATGQPEQVKRWLFDPKGEPRVAIKSNAGRTEVHWRGPDNAWQRIAEHPTLDAPFAPRFVDAEGALYVTVAEGPAGTTVLKRFDFTIGKPAAEAIVRTPGFDFTAGFALDAAGKVAGLHVTTDGEGAVWFSPRMNELQAIADRRFPGRTNRLSCTDCTTPKSVLVRSRSDQDPGSVWIYTPADDRWLLVGAMRGDIDPKAMATLDLQRIKARDGRDLPVWVTTPVGPKVGKRPAVVLVHGGPWIRGTHWEWDAQAQFLASRGYVVIEPEFRGSAGYGRSHLRAGWKHWGDTMQDDLADAVAWAATQGLVDDKRVCIAGASYGGYATLMSTVRSPELYRCGVAWLAVTDPRLLFQGDWWTDIPEEFRRFGLPTMVGDPAQDADLLRRAAPVERAAEIKAPLLLAFGAQDHRVPIEHGLRMRDALEAAGQAPEWIVYAGEGHGWLKPENELDFWRKVEAFLARHLK